MKDDGKSEWRKFLIDIGAPLLEDEFWNDLYYIITQDWNEYGDPSWEFVNMSYGCTVLRDCARKVHERDGDAEYDLRNDRDRSLLGTDLLDDAMYIAQCGIEYIERKEK